MVMHDDNAMGITDLLLSIMMLECDLGKRRSKTPMYKDVGQVNAATIVVIKRADVRCARKK
jgi:hypothetical protein